MPEIGGGQETGEPGPGSQVLDPSTLAVHLGRPPAQPGAAVNSPIELSSTFRAGGPSIYGRDNNSTWAALEAVLGGLEGGDALVFASGMAAIAAVVEAVPVGGQVVVGGDAYSGTRRFLGDAAARGRLSMRVANVADTEATLAICAEVSEALGARGIPGGLLWLESPTNPLLAIADLAALIAGGHRLGFMVAVDNTFATPILQRPLDLGADVVVHSLTKLLSGHSDVVLGAVVTAEPELAAQLALRRSLHGAIPGPFETFLALRGLRTLSVRLARAQETAAELARRLVGRPGVTGVRYPGLAGHPGHERAARQMKGFGTMLAFELCGGGGQEAAAAVGLAAGGEPAAAGAGAAAAAADAAEAVCRSVRLLTPGTSLGGVETLIERRARWAGESHLPPSLLRISVGLEHVEDLWADLDQALDHGDGW